MPRYEATLTQTITYTATHTINAPSEDAAWMELQRMVDKDGFEPESSWELDDENIKINEFTEVDSDDEYEYKDEDEDKETEDDNDDSDDEYDALKDAPMS